MNTRKNQSIIPILSPVFPGKSQTKPAFRRPQRPQRPPTAKSLSAIRQGLIEGAFHLLSQALQAFLRQGEMKWNSGFMMIQSMGISGSENVGTYHI